MLLVLFIHCAFQHCPLPSSHRITHKNVQQKICARQLYTVTNTSGWCRPIKRHQNEIPPRLPTHAEPARDSRHLARAKTAQTNAGVHGVVNQTVNFPIVQRLNSWSCSTPHPYTIYTQEEHPPGLWSSHTHKMRYSPIAEQFRFEQTPMHRTAQGWWSL